MKSPLRLELFVHPKRSYRPNLAHLVALLFDEYLTLKMTLILSLDLLLNGENNLFCKLQCFHFQSVNYFRLTNLLIHK